MVVYTFNTRYGNGGQNVYRILWERSGEGRVWNGTDLVAWNDLNVASYSAALTGKGGGLYLLTETLDIDPGDYKVTYYLKTGGSFAPLTADHAIDTDDIVLVEESVSSGGESETQEADVSGLTKLAAVNEILEAVNEYPVVTLDTGGSSDAARAES